MINRIQWWFETRAFGVCEWLGKKLGINSTKIRMYFIYLTFGNNSGLSEPDYYPDVPICRWASDSRGYEVLG